MTGNFLSGHLTNNRRGFEIFSSLTLVKANILLSNVVMIDVVVMYWCVTCCVVTVVMC